MRLLIRSLILFFCFLYNALFGNDDGFVLHDIDSQRWTYRLLLMPLEQEFVADALDVSPGQLQQFRRVREADFSLPSLRQVEAGPDASKALLLSLEERIRKEDARYLEFWDGDVLAANQRSGLLGTCLVRNGLSALAHPAWERRLRLTDNQKEKLQSLITRLAARSRKLLGHEDSARGVSPSEASALLDLRASRNLRFLNQVLTEVQMEELANCLRFVPARVQPRLTLGF